MQYRSFLIVACTSFTLMPGLTQAFLPPSLTSQPPRLSMADQSDSIYDKCWHDHFTAHNNLDLEGVVASYAEDCTLQEYNPLTKQLNIYKGHDGVRYFFRTHLASLNVNGNVTKDFHAVPDPPVVKDNTLWVYWSAESETTKYEDDVDTFIFKDMGNGEALIQYHYQFVHKTNKLLFQGKTIYEKCWDVHTDAYGKMDPAAIAAGYSDDCILQEFDSCTGSITVHKGTKGVEKFFTAHFKTLLDEDGRMCPMTMIPESPKVVDNTVWLSFSAKSATTEYKDSSDSFVMKETSPGEAKISFHYMHVNIV